jgi:hypothetical protein
VVICYIPKILHTALPSCCSQLTEKYRLIPWINFHSPGFHQFLTLTSPSLSNIHQHPRLPSSGMFIYPFRNTLALLSANQGSDMPLDSTTSSSRAAARPNEPKPNSSRETNTADISPPAVPPPAYTAVHNDVNGGRPLDRERGHDNTLPPYTKRGDGETNNGNNHDLEAGVAERAPPQRQRRRQRAVLRRQNQHVGGVILAIFIAILIYMAFKFHRTL